MNTEFKGSKGEWTVSYHSWSDTSVYCKTDEETTTVCYSDIDDDDYDEDVSEVINEANMELIADAGNTIQSCGLLPSELLKQRNEALELFQDINSEIIAGSKIDYATVLHHRILGFLKSAEVNP
jgi:hypothetical protein